MVYISLRVDKEVADYFNSFPSKSKKIREALEQYINQEEEKQNETK
jgi:metal-responsive CopG/Arc/MetJ family transcriptional regulator